jgi:multiple sugar transport system permease protein
MRIGIKYVSLYAAMSLAAIWALFPLVWIALASLKQPIDVASIPPKFLFRPTFASYHALFGSNELVGSIPLTTYLENSIAISTLSTFLTLLLSTPAAYAIARMFTTQSRGMSLFILSFRLIPPIALVVPLFVIFRQVALMDTRTALVLPYTALNIPLAVWMLQTFFLDLPPDLEHAAMVDGCSRFQAFVRVILPLVVPGLAAAAVFAFILAWNDFEFALPLTTLRAVTLPIMASRVVVDEGVLWGELGTVTVVLVVPVVLFSLAVQRYLVAGLRAGAIKE